MHQVTLERKIPYGAVEILVAVDAEKNTFLGFTTGIGGGGSLVFIEVARATLQELEKGLLDLHTLVTQRCIGMIFETSREALRAPMPA